MSIKFQLYSWSAKDRLCTARLFRLKAIFSEDSCDVFMHLPFFTIGLVISEEVKP